MKTTLNLRAAENSELATMNPSSAPSDLGRHAGSQAITPAHPHVGPISRKRRWLGRSASGLAVAFLLFDGLTKVLKVPWVVKASTQMGFPAGAILPIGLVLLACTIVYCVPRTAILGAVLLTGYLGGAVEVNVQAGLPLASHTLFPIYFAVFIWGGLALQDRRVWSIFAKMDARAR